MHRAFAVAVLAATATLAPSALATVVVVPPLEEMTLAADIVAEVVVTEQRLEQEPGRVVTFTTLQVVDGLKGTKAGDHLEVFQLGGASGGSNAWIVGAHRFQKGEHLVFFGMHHPQRAGRHPVVIPYGIGFGLFQVVDDMTGAKVVEIIGDVVTLPARGGAGEGRAPVQRRFDSLPAFKATLRQVLAGKDLPRLPTMDKIAPAIPKRSGP